MHDRLEGFETAAGLATVATDLSVLAGAAAPWRLSGGQVLSGIETAYRLATQAHTLAIRLVAEADRRGLPTDLGATSTTAWLTASQRMRASQAKRDVNLARLIGPDLPNQPDPPDTSPDSGPDAAGDPDGSPDGSDGSPDGNAAGGRGSGVEGAALSLGLAAGGVSVDQAGVIGTALAELPEDATTTTRVLVERLLVDEAAHHGPVTLTRLGHRILERVDPDAADRQLAKTLEREAREAERLRSGSRHVDGHGNVTYRFKIPVADDAWVRPVLDGLAKPQPGIDGQPDPRTPPQRLADAFVEAFRRLGLTGDLPDSGGDRPRATITIRLDQLRTGYGSGILLDTGDDLPVTAVRRLLCDAQIIPVILGGASQPLDVGRARRTFDGPLRLAVTTRDRGCIHPGCDRPPRWCDVHHVIPWWNGGRTALENGVMLCGFHHKLYDNGTWHIQYTPDGIPESIPPPWLDHQQHPRRHERFHHQAAVPQRE